MYHNLIASSRLFYVRYGITVEYKNVATAGGIEYVCMHV